MKKTVTMTPPANPNVPLTGIGADIAKMIGNRVEITVALGSHQTKWTVQGTVNEVGPALGVVQHNAQRIGPQPEVSGATVPSRFTDTGKRMVLPLGWCLRVSEAF